MALLTGTIRNLFGGVSQAPDEQRPESQFEEMVNMYPRAGFKLARRPPLRHFTELVNADLTGAFVHEAGDYSIVISPDGTLRVFNTASGVQIPVTNNAGPGYLAPAEDLRAVSVGTTTYLLNTSVTAAKGAPAAGTPSPRAHVTVRAGDYETKYTIILDGLAFQYTTPAQATAGSKADIATDAIAGELRTLIVANPAYQSTQYGSTLYIQRTNGADFTCTSYDGVGETGLSVAKDTVETIADLPPRAEWGTVLKVRGDAVTGADDFYMKTISSDGSSAVGDAWEETTEPGSQYTLDETTLPLQLVDNGDGTFTLDECPWDERAAGDDTTVPFPSFIGSSLTDIFVHQGRLGFITGDKIVLSEAGNFFNFFRTTAQQIVSSDPIDVSSSISGVIRLDYAINWNEAVYLFANGNAQYRLDSEGPLTVETIQIDHKSAYQYDSSVRPIVAGSRMFFVSDGGGYAPHVVDYHTEGFAREHRAVDTGPQVPTYFEGLPLQLAADDARGLLLLRTETGVYVYNYQYDNDDRVQGAWHRWTFGSGTILWITLAHGILLFYTAYADGTFLNYMVLDATRSAVTSDGTVVFPDGTTAELPHMDRLVFTTEGTLPAPSFDGTHTVYTLPYEVAVDGSEGTLGLCLYDSRTILTLERPSATTAKIAGDYAAAWASIGVQYTSSVELSTLYVRDRDGIADLRGRLHLRNLRLQYHSANGITVTVSSTGRSDAVTEFTSTYPVDGELVVPVLLRNKDANILIEFDSAGSEGLTGMSWEGTYHSRASRL
jgi:hypothetical protein